MKRLALLLTLGAALAGFAPAQAHCQTVLAHNTLTLNLAGDITVTMVEDGPVPVVFFPAPVTGICDDEPAPTEPDGYLEIRDAAGLLCRNDAVDPSFDPFAFGGGVHDMTGDCGADFSAESLTNPILPDTTATGADLFTVQLATTRDITTSGPGTYKVNGEVFVLPQDTPGVSKRAIHVTVEPT